VFPQHPETQFFQAQFAFLERDYKKAREILQQLLRIAPTNPKLLTLAGLVDYQDGAMLQAEASLSKVLQAQPDSVMARRVLGAVFVRTGKVDKALATLAPALESRSVDAETLALAAEANLQNGDFRTADALLQRAVKLSPQDPSIRTALAVSQLAKGNAGAAFADLQAIAKTDAGTTADLALISAHLRRNELPQALEAIAALEKKQPNRPFAAFMRARVLHLQNQVGPARESFQRALAIDPGYFPAVAALATLDYAENKPDQARQRFEDFSRLDPKNYLPRLALAEVRKRAGAPPAEIGEILVAAVKAAPAESPPRVALINHQLSLRDFKAATETAREAIAALPNSPDVLDAVGRSHLASGDINQGIATFKRLANVAPNLALPHVRLADAYVALKDPRSAIESLRRALDLQPDLLTAQRGIITLSMGAKRPQDAIDIARAVQKQRPQEPVGYIFEGDVEVLRRDYAAAIAVYRRGLQNAPVTELAIKLMRALNTAGQTAEGEKVAQEWERRHPNDAAFAFVRGDQALAQQNWAAAEQRFRSVLTQKPKDALALNNLAWLLMKQKKPGALPIAQQANELYPDRPSILDTLASALSEAGQHAKALEAQRRAIDLVPDDYALRLNLARIQIAAGDKAAAKTELERLRGLGTKFRDHAEVTELLKTLS
jgi:cellulose synthase operon protein C